MQIYKLLVTKTKHGYLAEQEDFDIAIDADTLENVINAAKNQIEQKGVLLLKNGEQIPNSNIIQDDMSPKPGISVIYIQTDIEKKFRDSATESVRKNISMPAWMDIKLRYYGVDASKLFQDAVTDFIKNKEDKENNNAYKKISNVNELIENVDRKILYEYVMMKLLK